MPNRSRSWLHVHRFAFVLFGAVTLTACSDVPRAFGPTPAAAKSNADAIFGALVGRFTNVVRVP